MAFLTRTEVGAYARNSIYNFSAKSAENLIAENVKVASAGAGVRDIFLSHRYADKVELVGLMRMLEDMNLTVFVDWREYSELSRQHVTRVTAAMLKKDMSRCRTLLFAVTSTASQSIWMPWELGLFDGMKSRVAIVPLTEHGKDIPGQEYLELYPWIDRAVPDGFHKPILWVNQGRDCYISLKDWVQGEDPVSHS